MSTDTLSNGALRIAVKRDGAELTSVADAAGTEYLWQGDPRVWSGQSPILFPIVGRLAGDAYAHAGTIYALPQHGFARRKEFRLVERGDAHLLYALGPDADSRAAYPFEFGLALTYALEGGSIRVGYRVNNLDRRPLPFSIGGHPGFSCSRRPGDALEDYFLEFERAETAETFPVRDGLLALDEPRRVLDDQTQLPLTKTLFDGGALVFTHLASSSVTLCSRRDPVRLRVDFPRFPCLGVWSKPAAPFVCIEPWFGHADPAGTAPASPLASKPGIVTLQPGRSFECAWRVSITPNP